MALVGEEMGLAPGLTLVEEVALELAVQALAGHESR